MYHAVIARIGRRNFERVNSHDYAAILKGCAPDIEHRFGGNHALGGIRHSREALGRWFARMGRVAPSLKLTVEDIWVKGGPWSTWLFIRWHATQTLADGGPYANRGVHVIHLRWGKVVSIDAHEDSQAVAEMLGKQAAAGIEEALAPPITS